MTEATVTQSIAEVSDFDSARRPKSRGSGTRAISDCTAVTVPPSPGALPNDWAFPMGQNTVNRKPMGMDSAKRVGTPGVKSQIG